LILGVRLQVLSRNFGQLLTPFSHFLILRPFVPSSQNHRLPGLMFCQSNKGPSLLEIILETYVNWWRRFFVLFINQNKNPGKNLKWRLAVCKIFRQKHFFFAQKNIAHVLMSRLDSIKKDHPIFERLKHHFLPLTEADTY